MKMPKPKTTKGGFRTSFGSAAVKSSGRSRGGSRGSGRGRGR